jgi:hypothetical protein
MHCPTATIGPAKEVKSKYCAVLQHSDGTTKHIEEFTNAALVVTIGVYLQMGYSVLSYFRE